MVPGQLRFKGSGKSKSQGKTCNVSNGEAMVAPVTTSLQNQSLPDIYPNSSWFLLKLPSLLKEVETEYSKVDLMSGNLFLLSFLYLGENNICFSDSCRSWHLSLFDTKNSSFKNNSLTYRLKNFWTFCLATPDRDQRKISLASRGHINDKDMYYIL